MVAETEAAIACCNSVVTELPMKQTIPDNSPAINITKITFKELKDFTDSCANSSVAGQLLPISPERVDSQMQNPYAEDHDIALVVAFSGPLCVGYHGLMPGICLCGGRIIKVYWATTFFVSSSMRGRGVGKLLIAAVLDLDIDFFVSRMTESAERAYLSMGLESFGKLHYRQLRADKLKKSLPGKGQHLRFTEDGAPPARTTIGTFLDRPLYGIFKKFFYTRLLLSPSLRRRHLTAHEVPLITDWSEKNPDGKAEYQFYRPVKAVNWMLAHPWVFSRSDKKTKSSYYFSTTRHLFIYKAFQIYDEKSDTSVGYVVVSILSHKGRTVVKLLDYAFISDDHEFMAMVVALRCAREYLADRVEYAEELNRYLGKIVAIRFIKKQTRLYLFHPRDQQSSLLHNRKSFTLNYCDGDVVFT